MSGSNNCCVLIICMFARIYAVNSGTVVEGSGVEAAAEVVVSTFLSAEASLCSSTQAVCVRREGGAWVVLPVCANTSTCISDRIRGDMLQRITRGNLQLCSLLRATAARHRSSTQISIAVITFPFYTLTPSTSA